MENKSAKQLVNNKVDNFEERIGIRYDETHSKRVGYLGNVKPSTFLDKDQVERAALLCYFIDEQGEWFKALFAYEPYFYLKCESKDIKDVIVFLNNQFESLVSQIEYVDKVDLNLPNHLSGKTQKYIKMSFKNVEDLLSVRKELHSVIEQSLETISKKVESENIFMKDVEVQHEENFLNKITELREYDVTYYNRACIDNEIRVSYWYEIHMEDAHISSLIHLKEKLDKPDLRIFTFDIETTKAELKFPDPQVDRIMMISYMIDGKGFLIVNREVVGEDIDDFEYTPVPEYEGRFTVFNEPNEVGLLNKFFEHIREVKPFIFVTFNGDYFDWPFIETRTRRHGMNLEDEIGIVARKNRLDVAYYGRFAAHLDCMYWVKRDAYLPQGSHGLKKVTSAKLGYDPVELDPEKMVEFAQNRPQELATYSVSDALATYYLYYKMIHDFIFALCSIIPSHPDDVLRKGSGTLCEELLMAQAFRGNIIFPNKKETKFERYYNNHLIEQDTYVGGHVEALKTGIFRSDFPQKFKIDKKLYQTLIDNVEKVIDFAVTVEQGIDIGNVANKEEVIAQVVEKLQSFINLNQSSVERHPLIYHVDVSAMYPNIILSNRLQPVSIVNDEICASCCFNVAENNCKRLLEWQWKVTYYPLIKKEYEDLKKKLLIECEHDKNFDEKTLKLNLIKRLKNYCSSVYKKHHENETVLKQDTVCMRENPFYVDTVRDFRDRRYQYKKLAKDSSVKYKDAMKSGDAIEEERTKNLVTLYESLQLAHKIILNSFYGYVMRRGARWYSMEMAAIVTHTGGSIIRDARILLDQLGIPLELDTDGIWCMLPKGFPESFEIKLKSGKTIPFEYICSMCNVLIYDKYANPQYQTLIDDATKRYETRTEMSIFFEIDGPYKCMMLPAAKEEGKMLKKRYAVFDHKNRMTEMKGFELKRRGELQIVKIFQSEVFDKFLSGSSLQECYDECGKVAELWYNILDTQGKFVTDDELIDYIGESRMMSKSLEEYGSQKSTSVTCARRMAELLGNDLVKDKGLNVKFLICKKPLDEPISERAIPIIVFQIEPHLMRQYLKKWCKDYGMKDFDMRSLIDWDYYKERVGSSILKIVTIPAALQGCENPFPKVLYPDWLKKKVKELNSIFKQKKLTDFMKDSIATNLFAPTNIEEIGKSKFRVRELTEKEKEIVQKQKEKEQEKELERLRIEEEEKNPIPIQTDFQGWLKCQKRYWRKFRKQRKEDPMSVYDQSGVMSMMKNFDEAFFKSTLQILDIKPTSTPGILKVWVRLPTNVMYPIHLQVNRKFYFYKVRYKILYISYTMAILAYHY